MKKEILIPVNGSDLSDKAIEFAAEIAGSKNFALHLIHVVRPATIPKGIGKYMQREHIQEDPVTVYVNLMGRPIVEKAEDKARNCGVKEVKPIVLPGDPAEVIVEYAKESPEPQKSDLMTEVYAD